MYHMMKMLADARVDDLRRDARRLSRPPVLSDSERREKTGLHTPITIRRATPSDAAQLRRVPEREVR